jgi:hypothetical protein
VAAKPGLLGTLPAKVASTSDTVPVATVSPEPATKAQWRLDDQVGAFPDENEPSAPMRKTKPKTSSVRPDVERMMGDGRCFAPFAGLDKEIGRKPPAKTPPSEEILHAAKKLRT